MSDLFRRSSSYTYDEYTEEQYAAADQPGASGRCSTPPNAGAPPSREPSISPSKRPLKLKEGAHKSLIRVASERAQSAATEMAQSAAAEEHPGAEPSHPASTSILATGSNIGGYAHSPSPIPQLQPPHQRLHSTSPSPFGMPNTNPQQPPHQYSYYSGYPYHIPQTGLQPYVQPYSYAQPAGAGYLQSAAGHHPQYPVPPPQPEMQPFTTAPIPQPPTTSPQYPVPPPQPESLPLTTPSAPQPSTTSPSPSSVTAPETQGEPHPPPPITTSTPPPSMVAEFQRESDSKANEGNTQTSKTHGLPEPSGSQDTDEAVAGDENVNEEPDTLLGSEGLPGLDEVDEVKGQPNVGGRPSKKKDACDAICKEAGSLIVKRCKEEGIESTMVYGAMGGKVSRAQRRKTRWNGYQSLATSKEFKAEELGRNKGALKWDGVSKPTGDQLKAAYRLFIEEHGEEKAKGILDVWSMMREIEDVQTRGERKRAFKAAINQFTTLAEYFHNRFNIQFWGLLAGGQVRTDQVLTHIFEPNGSAGFAGKGLAVNPEDLKDLYSVYILNQNAAKFTNQQIAAMARRRGLKVSGPGLDDDDGAPTTTPSPTSNPPTPINSPKARRTGSVPVPTSKKNVRDVVRDIVKTRFDECLAPLGKTFKVPANLPWATMVAECVKLGLQIVNYPPDINFPWTEIDRSVKKSNRGICDIPTLHQTQLIEACKEDHPHRLKLVVADPIKLENNKVPVLVTAPDSTGKVQRIFVKDAKPDGAEPTKAGGTTSKKVKFEENESIPPAEASSRTGPKRTSRNTTKPIYGLKDDFAFDSSTEEDELETPKPAKKAKNVAKGRSKTASPEKPPAKPTSSSRSKTLQPKKPLAKLAPTTTTSKGLRPANVHPPAASEPSGPSAPKKAIMMAEINNGGFRPLDPAALKRGLDSATVGDGPLHKKLKQDTLAARSTPTPVSKLAKTNSGGESGGAIPTDSLLPHLPPPPPSALDMGAGLPPSTSPQVSRQELPQWQGQQSYPPPHFPVHYGPPTVPPTPHGQYGPYAHLDSSSFPGQPLHQPPPVPSPHIQPSALPPAHPTGGLGQAAPIPYGGY
ncbi:hypothetical protein AAF712_015758 [Marasmius tenuissimus]|uniref:Uncharacterized protein n=1 Tax=Marasmius tenuissimus TaxID=585030 RepID=A0ABR2Z8D8_9AGAR